MLLKWNCIVFVVYFALCGLAFRSLTAVDAPLFTKNVPAPTGVSSIVGGVNEQKSIVNKYAGQPKGRSLLGPVCPTIRETNPMSGWVLRTNQKVTVGHFDVNIDFIRISIVRAISI